MPDAGCVFDRVADEYDAARPTYPDQLYRDLERLARPLRGADVLDVGAGTGIATRGLLSRGARVIAVDASEEMLARLRRHSADITTLVADAHALPLKDHSMDLVCFAQSWHWMRAREAAVEAVRVLRASGALAIWWNNSDARSTDWWQDQVARIQREDPAFTPDYRSKPYGEELRGLGLFASITTASARWVRELGVDTYLVWLRSKTYVAALGDRLPIFLEAERDSLLRAFPDGVVREPFRTDLYVARLG